MTTTPDRKAFAMFVPGAPGSHRPRQRLGAAAAAVVAVLALSACGSDTPDPVATASAEASGAPNGVAFEEVRACLEAAGLDTSGLPSGAPPEMPSVRPGGMPSGAPSDLPSGPPPGMTSGGPGGEGGAMMLGAEAQAALVACGITMPSRPPAGAATPAPTASP